MGLKSRLIEFVVKRNLIPVRFRWMKCASGVGRLFCDVYNMLGKEDRRRLRELTNVKDADVVVEMLV